MGLGFLHRQSLKSSELLCWGHRGCWDVRAVEWAWECCKGFDTDCRPLFSVPMVLFRKKIQDDGAHRLGVVDLESILVDIPASRLRI